MSTQVQWLTPPPLWQELSSNDLTAYRRPAILRFATDTFMQDLQGVLESAPQTLRNYVAAGETWKTPVVGLDAVPGNTLPLKLYQPSHARFYLIATSLTCRMPGLPDHTVDKTANESVAFVVRQLRPNPGFSASDCAVYSPATCTEYAWVPSPQPGWMQASVPGQVVPALIAGEEQILLSLTHTGSNGGSRRIFLGLIPASRRQQYVAGRTLAPSGSSNGGGNVSGSGNGNGTPIDPRMDLFFRQVIGPLGSLQDWWNSKKPDPPTETVPTETISQMSSALILYDFATFLSQNLPDVWAVVAGTASLSTLNSAEAALYNALGSGLQAALVNANQFGPQFEAAGPSAAFPPAGYSPYALTDASNHIDSTSLQAAVSNALPPLSTLPSPPAVLPPLPQKPANPQGDFYFIIRCVYLRPQCPHHVISPPSQPFQLANYFDSDAPARRIQVALPVDTSAAALRKYDKGVAFLISDELNKQMQRVASLNDLSNGDIGSPGLGLGFICSLSIPIITICAMILLFVIVIALNLVFFWVPFFKICFPVPTLKGKS